MENYKKFFTELYSEFGKTGYREVYATLGKCFKKGHLKKYSKKFIKKYFVTMANLTYFAYAVVNYKTVKRPSPDPTSNPVGEELKKYFGQHRVDRILLKYETLFWVILRDYFKVDLNDYSQTKPYSEFLYPPDIGMDYSYGIADTKNRVRVSPGGPTNRYNKHIFH